MKLRSHQYGEGSLPNAVPANYATEHSVARTVGDSPLDNPDIIQIPGDGAWDEVKDYGPENVDADKKVRVPRNYKRLGDNTKPESQARHEAGEVKAAVVPAPKIEIVQEVPDDVKLEMFTDLTEEEIELMAVEARAVSGAVLRTDVGVVPRDPPKPGTRATWEDGE